MHLACLNVPQHLVQIWRNTLKPRIDNNYPFIVLHSDDVWKNHGALVASARPYLPGSFNRTPRNPAEKVNSGYKAWEFNLYFYVLGPAVFRLVLPHYLWTHFCQLVCGIRIIFQRRITSNQITKAHEMLIKWGKEFEEYYYQRDHKLLHLVRPSTHAVHHLALETVRCGPLNLVAQWVLEDTVGNIGREVHQHSNPFANLTQRGLLRAQTNALMSLVPELNELKLKPGKSGKAKNPFAPLGDGFVLLAAREKYHDSIPPAEKTAILRYRLRYLSKHPLPPQPPQPPQDELMIRKWARLRLPNGQKARCAWKEQATSEKRPNFRNSRNIKVGSGYSSTYFAEVMYYLQILVGNIELAAAMVCPYRNPPLNSELLRDSHGTLHVCQRQENTFYVIDIKSIQSVVAMIPFPLKKEEEDVPAIKDSYKNTFYVGEKPFFELTIEGNDDNGSDSDEEDRD
ncbi:hypothetical protein F5887DRAFT_888747 [Amanita rubescens]|nr:hypothetical protein F5887DRAFT_888747 [Amanita rubescens]